MSSSIKDRLPSKVVFHRRSSSIKCRLLTLSCPRAAPKVPPKWIKQNELGCLDNKLTGTDGQTDGQDNNYNNNNNSAYNNWKVQPVTPLLPRKELKHTPGYHQYFGLLKITKCLTLNDFEMSFLNFNRLFLILNHFIIMGRQSETFVLSTNMHILQVLTL